MVFKTFENGTFSTGLFVHPIECLGDFLYRFFVGKKSPCRIDYGVLQVLFPNCVQSAGALSSGAGKTRVVIIGRACLTGSADPDHRLFTVAAY